MKIGIARVFADDTIDVLQGALITPVQQIEQRLSGPVLNTALRLQLLNAAARHLYHAVVAERKVSFGYTQVHHRVSRLHLRSMRISNGGFAPLALRQRCPAPLQISLDIGLCFHKLSSGKM